jgi:hypothetical protein
VSAQRPSSRALGRKAGDRSRRHATRRETGSRRQGGILRARARALRADLPDAAFVRTPWIETIATDREWPRRTRDAVAGGGEAGARVHSPRKTAGVPRAGACGRRRPARRGLADPCAVRLRDPQHERVDHLVDLPGRDADDVRLLDDGDERCSERFRGSRKDGKQLPRRSLGIASSRLACPRVPRPRVVAVPMREPLRRPFTRSARSTPTLPPPSAAQRSRRATRTGSRVPRLQRVADDLLRRHPLPVGHRGVSSRQSLAGPTSNRHGGGTTVRLPPMRSYTTLWDVTITRN